MGATSTIVTSTIAFVGMRVCRGRDWDYGSQDQYEGELQPGTITLLSYPYEDCVKVRWDKNNHENSYAIGRTDRYTLYVWEDTVEAPKAKPASTPKTEELLNDSSYVSVGESLIFRRHIGDSTGGTLYLGQSVTVKEVQSTYIKLESCGSWWYSKACFVRGGSADPVPAAIDPNCLGDTDNLEVGDGIHFFRHVTDSMHSALTPGDWTTVTAIRGDRVHIQTSRSPELWIHITAFDSVSPIQRKYLAIAQVEIGDSVRFARHKVDSRWANITIGEWVTVICKTPDNKIVTSKKDNFKVSIECFSEVRKCVVKKPIGMTTQEAAELGAGDIVRLVNADKDRDSYAWGMKEGFDYKIISTHFGGELLRVQSSKGPTNSLHSGAFILVSKALQPDARLAALRDSLTETEVKVTSGIADWGKREIKVGDEVTCIYVTGPEVRENNVEIGTTFEVAMLRSNGTELAGKGHSRWMDRRLFVPSDQTKGLAKKKNRNQAFSSTIKPKKDDTNTSDRRVIRTGSGAIKVRTATPKIREGQKFGGCAVRVRSSKARIGW